MITPTTTSMKNPVRFRLMIFVLYVVSQVANGEKQMRCIPSEREALLKFKAAIVDDYGMLSSWSTPHCCQWEGIRCSNLTSHVLGLHLPGEVHLVNDYAVLKYMSGEIHKSLMELPQLQYLNLYFNTFPYTNIPEFLGSLRNLKYLDLSFCDFGGEIPSQFGSLSHLKYLNLAGNNLNGSIPHQLGNLSKLQHLDLNGNYFKGNIPSQLGNLFRLQYLDLRGNSFEENMPSQLGNLSQLQELYLSNNINFAHGGKWLPNLLSLTHLYFDSVSNLNQSPTLLQAIAKLPQLRELSLVSCSLSDDFILSSMPSKFNSSTSLSVLHLPWNTFTSSMVFQWVSNITSNLVELDLTGNHLEGFTSSDFGIVMNSLRYLHLSSNYFKAKDLKYFTNICTLHSLYLYLNNLTEDLPSILSNLSSSGCVRHSLQELDLRGNYITGTLSDISVFSSLKALFLDENWLSATIPEGVKLPSTLEDFSIRSNSIQGGIPKSFGSACALHSFDMSNNSLTVELPTIISHLSGCARYSLKELYLHMNQINGTLPDVSTFTSLKILYLHNNKLNGEIPMDIQFPSKLEGLYISSNSLKGVLTDYHFANMFKLVMLDLSENKLSGFIPNWIGTMEELQILSLRKNQLFGSLPFKICFLRNIQFLDLSLNNFSGKIPNCIRNLKSMAETISANEGFHLYWLNSIMSMQYYLNAWLTWKGSEQMFMSKGLTLLKTIDLSSNQFSDEIPIEIGKLCGLISLNLSRNNLIGKIPSNIGKLTSLDSLDLSRNQFVGSIPSSLAQIYGLSVLDLSHNHLTGKIPTSTQLQSFSISSYEDNLGLCGPPLQKCIEDGSTQEPNVEVEKDEYSLLNNDFYVSMAFGFVVSFLMVFGSILFVRSWRHAYFNFLNNLENIVYVKIRLFVRVLKLDKD